MREQWRAELDAMPTEEREAIRERMRANRPEGGDREGRRERWQSMSDEERAAMHAERQERRAERRERWESMSDEERAAVQAQRQERKAERRQRWESMTDEERAAAREKMRNQKAIRHHRGEPKPANPGGDSG